MKRSAPLRRTGFGQRGDREAVGKRLPNPETIPYGYCHCGCGKRTPLASRTSKQKGWVKGEPTRFLHGHAGGPKESFSDLTNFKVDAVGCWVWQGALSHQGYGATRYGGKYTPAHRAVRLSQGREIPEGWHLHHACRNKSCVNPAHLRAVSPEQHDREHERERRKLTDRDIAEIKRRARAGEPHPQIAEDFPVSRSRIQAIASGKQRRRGVSPASISQRVKVRDLTCVVCGAEDVDPAHLIPRSLTSEGQDDPLAVVALCRIHHDEYDAGDLSILEYLEPRYRLEVAFAVERVGLIFALKRITNSRWVCEGFE